jgi:hypothetical protein
MQAPLSQDVDDDLVQIACAAMRAHSPCRRFPGDRYLIEQVITPDLIRPQT